MICVENKSRYVIWIENLEELKAWVKAEGFGSLAKFIREAIEEKRERITNPPQTTNNGLPIIFKTAMEQQEKKTEKLVSMIKNLQQDLARRNGLLDIIKQRSRELAGGPNPEDIEIVVKAFNTIMNRVQRDWVSVQELINESYLGKAVVMHVLTNSGRFTIKKRGWALNE